MKYQVGEKLHFRTWKALLEESFKLSSEGYGVCVIGFSDMSRNTLTITAEPEGVIEHGV